MNTHQSQPKNGGFVILFVVLIASIILLIGAGIFTISFKENILSSSARESQFALAAADAGVECALYHDTLMMFASSPLTASIECVGTSLDLDHSGGPGFSNFMLPISEAMNISGVNLPCALVTIDKNYFDPDANAEYTFITSKGYNVCDNNGPVVSDPLLLERVLEVKYPNPVVVPPSSLSTSTSSAIPAASVPAASVSTSRQATPQISDTSTILRP